MSNKIHLIQKKETDIATKFAHLIVYSLIIIGFGCMKPNYRENNLSIKPTINTNSCLASIEKNNLKKVLDICKEVINKYPNSPYALNDRSLIYTIMGEQELACQDTKIALDLIKENQNNIDPLIKYQLKIRDAACKKR